MHTLHHRTIIFLGFIFFFIKISAQDSLKNVEIAPVTVSAARLTTTTSATPFAVTVLTQNQIQKGQPKLSLNESLVASAGVFTLNPDNFSQDLRISIRGYGARAAFGIRGVRLIVDEIPESTPDGQADVDNLDMGSVQRLEILRGANAGLYGNASGGILYIQTEEAGEKPFFETQISAGSYGFVRMQGKAGRKTGNYSQFISIAHQRLDGFRAHARMNQTIVNAKIKYEFSPTTQLKLLFNYGNSPLARDPGALTQAQIDSNNRQARLQTRNSMPAKALSRVELGLFSIKK
ncbi:MAG: TonB-dependent receptor plug domain-containing protein [Saprospiraceae bacterium]|nr:TonB-dependent receptor plug domain-containing protein [Saprospiraceae bacterium]